MNYNNTLYYGVSKTQIGTYSQIQSVSSIANNANANANTKAFIKIGSYIGTDTYGVNNPTSLSLDFPIGFVWIFAYQDMQYNGFYNTNDDYHPFLSYQLLTTSYQKDVGLADRSDLGDDYGKISSDGKTIYWYNTFDQGNQYNNARYKYFYMLISR